MPKTIPQLTDATTVNAADELIIQQGGITKRATGAELAKGLNAINSTINVKDFGAVGDGTADDTAAIQAANDTGNTVYFPHGTYCATTLNMTTNWVMSDGSLLKFIGAPNSLNFINCTASNLTGNLNVSGNNSHVRRLINIDGNNNVFSKIVAHSVTSPAISDVHVAIRIGGNNNKILEAVGFDLLNTGNTNSSSPQFVTLAGTSNNNQIAKITSNNARCSLLVFTPNNNFVGDILTLDSGDNGVYCASGKTVINSLSYGGNDEAAVFIDGANAVLGTLTVTKSANACIRINSCGVVDVGTLNVLNNGILRLFRQSGDNTATSNTLRIGHIQGEYEGDSLFQLLNGSVQQLTISSMDIVYIYTAGTSTLNWARADIAEGISIGTANITVVDKNNTLTASEIFELRLRNPLLRPSIIHSWNVSIVNSDRTTNSSAQARINSIGDQNLTVMSGYVQTNAGNGYLREIQSTIPSDRLTANNEPSVGTWKRGQIFWRAFPVAGGSSGWICVTGGSPGTWKNMNDIAA
jgi:hypothetical protein